MPGGRLRRRDLIKLFLALGLGELFLSHPASAQKRQGHIIVLGAGMSGLAAAQKLKSAGFSVLILEARERIGGRIHSDLSLFGAPGAPVEMGACWIHSSRGNPITALAKRYNIATMPTHYDNAYLVDSKGNDIPDDDAEHRIENIIKRVKALGRHLDRDISFEEGVKQVIGRNFDRRDKEMLAYKLADMECDEGTDMSNWSLRGDPEGPAGDDKYGGPDVLFPQGYSQLIEAIASGLDVRLGHVAKSIVHSEKGVRIQSSGGAFEADAAVITLPLGVLKDGAVQFSPPLPAAKQKAIDEIGFGNLEKALLSFPQVFWPPHRDYLEWTPAQQGYYFSFLNYYKINGRPALVCEMAGEFARSQDILSDHQVGQNAMQAIRTMFPRKAIEPDKVLLTRWSQDPYARGSYAYQPVGVSGEAFDVLASKVGRLYFAGEATHRGSYATVHGAYLSGLREAGKVIQELG